MADKNVAIEKDIQAIIEAGGSDNDVLNYLKENNISHSVSEDRSNETPEETGNRMWKGIGETVGAIFNPNISPEQALSTDAGRIAVESLPFTNTKLGYLPPPYGNMLPPRMMANNRAEIASNESSLAAILGNIGTGVAIGAPVARRMFGQTKEAFKNPAKAVRAFDEWKQLLTKKATASKADIQSGLSQRIGELSGEGLLARQTRRDELAKSISSMRNKTNQQISVVENNLSKQLAGIDETAQSLSGKLGKASAKEAEQLQKDTLALFQTKSEKYGNRLAKLLEKADDVPAQGVHDALEQALIDHNVLQINQYGVAEKTMGNLSSTEAKWLSMYENLSSAVKENPSAKIAAADLLKTEQQLKVPFGNVWGKDEHLAASIKERLGDTLETSVKGLSELKGEFSPYFKLKRDAIKKLGIFSDTKKASRVLRNVAEPMGKSGSEERRLIGLLEKELGGSVGSETKTIQSGFGVLKNQKTTARQSAEDIINRHRRDLAEEIFNMRKSARSDIDEIRSKYDLLIQKHKDDTEYVINKLMDSKDASIERLRSRIDKLQQKYRSARTRTKVGVALAVSATPVGKYLLRTAIEAILQQR